MLPPGEELKGRVAALEGEKISTETVEETVDKSFWHVVEARTDLGVGRV